MSGLKQDDRWIRYAVGIAVLLAAAYFVNQLDDMTANTVAQAFLRAVRSVVHVSLLISWCASLRRRIMNVQVRRMLVAISMLMAFWLTAKIIKYEFIADRTFWLGRYIWYSYYIPMILIPLLGVFIIDHMGKPEGYRNPRWMKRLYMPAFAILIGVFTNDLHQLAFDFPQGIESFDYVYGYGPVYFAAMAWFVLLGVYFVIAVLKKSRVPGSRGMQRLPVLIMGGAVLFWTLYCLGFLREVDLTVVDCLIISLLLESAIQSGLIPSNTNYHVLFRASTVAAQIVNRDNRLCFASASAMALTEDEMRRIEAQPVKLGNTILQAKPVKGGYVLWQDDVTEVDALMAQLRDVQRQLGRENELLQAELKLKGQRAQIEEKNRVYDRIERDVEPQLKKMEQLLARGADLPRDRNALAMLCVIGSYLKRRSNLVLLGEERQTISAREIEYCIRESLDNLQLVSVSTMLDARCDGELRLESVIAAYDFYERLVERLLDRLTAVIVGVSGGHGTLKMRLQLGCGSKIEKRLLEDICPADGSVTCTMQEKAVVIELVISEGGAGQ